MEKMKKIKKANIIKTVETNLPELVKAVNSEGETVMMHTEAFAVDYNIEEMVLMAMAIKYVGFFSKNIIIIGGKK